MSVANRFRHSATPAIIDGEFWDCFINAGSKIICKEHNRRRFSKVRKDRENFKFIGTYENPYFACLDIRDEVLAIMHTATLAKEVATTEGETPDAIVKKYNESQKKVKDAERTMEETIKYYFGADHREDVLKELDEFSLLWEKCKMQGTLDTENDLRVAAHKAVKAYTGVWEKGQSLFDALGSHAFQKEHKRRKSETTLTPHEIEVNEQLGFTPGRVPDDAVEEPKKKKRKATPKKDKTVDSSNIPATQEVEDEIDRLLNE